MEIKLILSPNDAAKCGLPEITVDYTTFIRSLEDDNLDDIDDVTICACLEKHLCLDAGYLDYYKVVRQPTVVQVSR